MTTKPTTEPTTELTQPPTRAIISLPQLLQSLADYQEKFFQKTGDLYENIEQLGNEFYNLMLADLKTTYKKGAEILLKITELEYVAAKYEIKCKQELITPGRRTFRFWKRNEPGELIYREVWADVQKMFNARTKAIEKLETALKEATKNENPFGEPKEPEKEKPENAPKTAQGDEFEPAASSTIISRKGGTQPRALNKKADKREGTKAGE